LTRIVELAPSAPAAASTRRFGLARLRDVDGLRERAHAQRRKLFLSLSELSSPRAQIATSQPSAARPKRNERPMPRLPPVTITTLPLSPRSTS